MEQSASFIAWGEAYSEFFQIPLNSTTKNLGRTKLKNQKQSLKKCAFSSQKQGNSNLIKPFTEDISMEILQRL